MWGKIPLADTGCGETLISFLSIPLNLHMNIYVILLLNRVLCFPLCQRHIQTFVPGEKPQTVVCTDQTFGNGLNFLGFSCCLLFCVGGNPIGGLRKSQNKWFQMMMSCRKKERKSWKKAFDSLAEKRGGKKSHGALTLISCWHKTYCAVR